MFEYQKELAEKVRLRNEKIIQGHRDGKSYNELAKEYDLTTTRIGQIIVRWKKSVEKIKII